jgi:DHA1 family tetracycline resistance protein-like MFS transporter
MSLRTRFWLLAGIRWLSTGFVVPVAALLPLERGLTIAEYGTVAAMQGVAVLVLELPTGGFADAVGRRPVWVCSAVVSLISCVVTSMAHGVATFMLAAVLAGTYRALDSGPLNAWFVDTVHDTVPAAERSDVVVRGLSGYASVVGIAIATGGVLSAGLVAWAPLGGDTVLATPYWVAAGLCLVQVVAAVVLMDEHRSARLGGLLASVRATPAAVLDGGRLLARSRVLRALVAVGLFWGFGMVAFESMTPIRLSEILGDRDHAAAVMGPVTAAAWGVSALGAATVPFLLHRWSPVAVSVALRLVQGATVVAMGVAGGAVGLVAGLFATYAVHSAAGAIYETLLHEQVDNRHRATVLSLASMAMHPGASVGGIALGAIATSVSTSAALVVGGLVLAAAAPLFLVRAPARVAAQPAPMLDREGVPGRRGDGRRQHRG